MRIIAVNLQYICHSDSREKHPNAKASMYPASSKIITLVSFHLSSHHLYLGLLHCSHYVSMILSQSNSPFPLEAHTQTCSHSATEGTWCCDDDEDSGSYNEEHAGLSASVTLLQRLILPRLEKKTDLR